MNVVQLLGPPCSGKSHLVNQLERQYSNILHYDVASTAHRCQGYDKVWERLFASIINDVTDNEFLESKGYAADTLVIVESVIGSHLLYSRTILLTTELSLWKERHEKRDIEFTDELLDYYSQLETKRNYLTMDCTIEQARMWSKYNDRFYPSTLEAFQAIMENLSYKLYEKS